MRSTILTVFTLVLLGLGTGRSVAARGPLTVSPGGVDNMSTIADRCPTFSWSAAATAGPYQLVVYRLDDREVAQDATELFRVSLPAGSQAWTPPVEQCLERGGRYAWSVRTASKAGEEGSAWGPPALFSVALGPSVAELESLLSRQLRTATSEGPSPVAGTDETTLKGVETRSTNNGGNHFIGALSVAGDGCFGEHCSDGESYPLGTIRIDSDNTSITFNDGSTIAGFPTNDWTIQVNDSTSGGEDYFAIQDTTAGTTPFRIDAGATANSMRIADGFVDFGGDLLLPDGELTAGGVELASSREWKQDFESVDPQDILAKLEAIPIGTWAFERNPEVRHIGPYSEDFHTAFDLPGHDPRHLAITDVNGVALAAIQGLAARIEEQRGALEGQRHEIEELKRRNEKLEELVVRLDAARGVE